MCARLFRLRTVQALVDSPRVRDVLVGESPARSALVQQVVEVAVFSQGPVLITGESGTGKELIARLIHDLDRRVDKAAGSIGSISAKGLTRARRVSRARASWASIHAAKGLMVIAHTP